jgi:hypothetical protein
MLFTEFHIAKRSGLLAAALTVGLLAFGAPAKAREVAVDGWKIIEFPGIAPSRFVKSPDGGIEILSDKSSAMLYRALGPQESGRRYLTWRWRVDAAPPPTDLTRRGGDRPLAMHLCFKGKSRDSGFLDWMSRVIRPDVDDFTRDHRCLTYVWGGSAAAGLMFPNPYMKERGFMVVLRGVNAPTGEWFMEKIDCAKDYRTAFGEDAPKPSFIAISGDSDETKSIAAGSIAALTFRDN